MDLPFVAYHLDSPLTPGQAQDKYLERCVRGSAVRKMVVCQSTRLEQIGSNLPPYGKQMVFFDFQTPSSNFADARDGLELPVVVDYITLQYRL